MVKLAEAHCHSLIPDTTQLATKFEKLFQLFAKCHNIYDQNYVSSDDINNLGQI